MELSNNNTFGTHEHGELVENVSQPSGSCSVNYTKSNDITSIMGRSSAPKQTRRTCTAGRPISCALCLKVWNKLERGGRFYMFGGTRAFMAKFEAKMKSLLGSDHHDTLKSKTATKFGRSYICPQCFVLVQSTYDDLRALQRCVAKTTQLLKRRSKETQRDILQEEEEESGSEQDLDICQVFQPNKISLPSVRERITEKVASLTSVTINHKSAMFVLKRIDECSTDSFDQALKTEGNIHDSLSMTAKEVGDYCWGQQEITSENSITSTLDQHQIQDNISPGARFMADSTSNYCDSDMNQLQCEIASKDFPFRAHDKSNFEFTAGTNREGSSVAHDTADILLNPLLLVKYPTPINLASVRDANIFMCTDGDCGWTFYSKFLWENHIRHYHNGGKPFKCLYAGCGRSFSCRSKLELHIRSHTDERPFVCDVCGSGFRGNQELKAHKLTHNSGNAYQCPKCDKRFKLRSSLKRHLQFHDGDLPYKCGYQACQKAFKNRYDLKCHFRLHTGEKPYKCQVFGCGAAFRIPSQFTLHRRSHTGERPFVCSEPDCSAPFASSSAVQAHLLTHTQERPFCCELCGKTFKQKFIYRSHVKAHTVENKKMSPHNRGHLTTT